MITHDRYQTAVYAGLLGVWTLNVVAEEADETQWGDITRAKRRQRVIRAEARERIGQAKHRRRIARALPR